MTSTHHRSGAAAWSASGKDGGPIVVPFCPAPAEAELRRWVALDWDSTAVHDTARDRPRKLRGAVCKVVTTIVVTAVVLGCLLLWWSASLEHGMSPGMQAGFALLFLIGLLGPCALSMFWVDSPRRRYPLPVAVAQPEGTNPHSTDPLRNTRFLDKYTTSVGGVATLRALWDRSVAAFGSAPCLAWRTVQHITTEPFTYGLDDGGCRTRMVEKWVLADTMSTLDYNGANRAMLQAGGGLVALLEDLQVVEAANPGSRRGSKPHVGVLASSRPEGSLIALAGVYHGLNTVLLPWSPLRTLQHSIEATQCTVLVCESHQLEVVSSLMCDEGDATARRCRSVKVVVPLQDRNDPEWSMEEPMLAADAATIMAGFTTSQTRAVQAIAALGASIMPWRALLALGLQTSPLLAPKPVATPEGEPGPALISSLKSTASTPSALLPGHLFSADRVSRDTPAVIVFSAGSRGQPRAVQLSNGNVLAALASYAVGIPGLAPEDVMLSHSPLSAPLELVMQMALLSQGGSIAFGYHDTLTAHSKRIPHLLPPGSPPVVGDAALVRPTLMSVVPSQLDRLTHEVQARVDSGGWLYASLVVAGRKAKIAAAARGHSTPVWDWMVFESLRRETFGGNLRVVLCSGGALLPPLHQFMTVVMACPVVQVYGCAESCGVGAMSWPLRGQQDSTGPPSACGRFKLVDWPDIGVSVGGRAMPIGEVCLAGAHIGARYSAHGSPEATREWLPTGDVGQVLGDGSLHILGRKHELVRLSNGKLVSLSRIEAACRLNPYVSAVVAHADGTRGFAVVLVVPDLHALLRTNDLLGADKDISLPRSGSGELRISMHVLVHSNVAHTFLLQQVQQCCADAGMSPWQAPHGIALVQNEWSMESGTLTHTGAPLRHRIQEEHTQELERAYRKAGRSATALSDLLMQPNMLDDAEEVGGGGEMTVVNVKQAGSMEADKGESKLD